MSEFPLDDLDRRIAVGLQADGRASWTAIARRCGVSAATVSRRGQRLLSSGTALVVVTRSSVQDRSTSMFWLRIRCRHGRQPEVLARLADESSIRFLAAVTGRYDIVAEFGGDPTSSAFGQLVSGPGRIEGIERCDSDLILHEHKIAQDWSTQLLDREGGTAPVHEPHECAVGHLDDLDERIIARLHRDGRLPFSSVAAELDLDETTVRRRFEAMSARGCIRTLTLVPAAALGFTSEVLLDLDIEPARIHDVASALVHFTGVRYVADLLNTASLLCALVLPNSAMLHEFLTGTVARLPGVRGWSASMELLTVRRGYVQTPWWRDQLTSVT